MYIFVNTFIGRGGVGPELVVPWMSLMILTASMYTYINFVWKWTSRVSFLYFAVVLASSATPIDTKRRPLKRTSPSNSSRCVKDDNKFPPPPLPFHPLPFPTSYIAKFRSDLLRYGGQFRSVRASYGAKRTSDSGRFADDKEKGQGQLESNGTTEVRLFRSQFLVSFTLIEHRIE